MDKKSKLNLKHRLKQAASSLFATFMVLGLASPVLGTAVNAEEPTTSHALTYDDINQAVTDITGVSLDTGARINGGTWKSYSGKPGYGTSAAVTPRQAATDPGSITQADSSVFAKSVFARALTLAGADAGDYFSNPDDQIGAPGTGFSANVEYTDGTPDTLLPQVKVGDILDYGSSHEEIAVSDYDGTGVWVAEETDDTYNVVVFYRTIATSRAVSGPGADAGESLSRVWFVSTINKNVSVDVNVNSALPQVTDGNSEYSLAGAKLHVQIMDAAGKPIEGYEYDLTTDEKGAASTGTIKVPGYADHCQVMGVSGSETYAFADSDYHALSFNAEGKAAGTFAMAPKIDANAFEIVKVNAGVKENAQSMEGAEFTVKYFANGDASGDPAKTWVIKSVKTEDGAYKASLSDSCKVSGDDFYRNADGAVVLPYGTITVQETKAPIGYAMTGAYSVQNGKTKISDGKAGETVTIKSVLQDTGVSYQASKAAAEILNKAEDPISGTLTVQKYDALTGKASVEGDAENLQTTFRIYNHTGYTKSIDGKSVKDGAYYEFKTDKDGYKKVSGIEYSGTEGYYSLVEASAPKGYAVDSTEHKFNITIQEDGVTGSDVDFASKAKDASPMVSDKPIMGGFSFRQLDAETAERNQGDTDSLQGTFHVINKSDKAVVVNGAEYKPDEVIDNMTFSTDKNGLYESDVNVLPYGTYEIVPVKAPANYEDAEDASTTFQIREDGKLVACKYEKGADGTYSGSNVIANHVYKGKMNLTKVLGQDISTDTEFESGAVYDIVLARYVYQINNKTVGETITHDDVVNAYEHRNDASVTDAKGEKFTGFADAEFDQITTDEKGKASTKDLACGEYMYVQVDGNVENDIDNGVHVFTISTDHEDITVKPLVNEPKKATVKIVKKDADTGRTVTYDSASYQLRCISLKKYDLASLSDKQKEKIGLNSDNMVTWVNRGQTYTTFRTFAQQTADGKGLQAGVFYPVSEDGAVPDGAVNEPVKLTSGKYQLIETDDPYGFTKSNAVDTAEDGTFTLDASQLTEISKDGTYTLVVTNTDSELTGSLFASVKLDAKDADKYVVLGDDGEYKDYDTKDLSGFGFTLTAAEDITSVDTGDVIVKAGDPAAALTHDSTNPYSVIGQVMCDKDGNLVIGELPLGHYTLKETAQPSGTVASDKAYDVVVKEDPSNDEQTIVTVDNIINSINNEVSGNPLVIENHMTAVSFSKGNTAGKKLAGAELTLTDAATGKEITSWTSSDEQKYTVYGLTPGHDYTLTETFAPKGYVKAAALTFTAGKDADPLDVVMTDKIYTVTKTDVDGKALAGAELTVIDKETGDTVDTWTSDADGSRKVEGLAEGRTYTLHEEKAVDGYVKAADVDFTVAGADADGKKTDEHYDFVNLTVGVDKTDAEGKALEGAELTVTDNATGEAVDTWTTDGKAHAVSGLEEGKAYTIHEAKAPEGYAAAADISFTAAGTDKDGKKEGQSIAVIDTRVLVKSVNTSGTAVTGAKLSVLDSEGNTVDTWTVDADNAHYVNGLAAGATYTLREDEVPQGYVKAADMSFTVGIDGADQTVEVANTVGKVVKADENGAFVNGAELEVTDAAGNVVDKWVSGQQIVDLTEEQTASLKKGESIEVTKDDGTTVKVTAVKVSADKDAAEKTDSYVYEAAVTGAAGSVRYYEINTEGRETKHLVAGLTAGGTYKLTETKTVNGYYADAEHEFTVDGKADVEVASSANSIQYEIAKVDEKGKNVEGVTLKLTDITDANAPEEVKLPNDGVTTRDHMTLDKLLKAGHKYKLEEVNAKGGVYAAESVEFEVAMTGTSDPIVITMTDAQTNVSVTAADNHGNALVGAKMQILEAVPVKDETSDDTADKTKDEAEKPADEADVSTDDKAADADATADPNASADAEATAEPDATAADAETAVTTDETAAADEAKAAETAAPTASADDTDKKDAVAAHDAKKDADASDEKKDSDTADDAKKDTEAEDTKKTVKYAPATDENGNVKVVYEFTTTAEPVDISSYVTGGTTYILHEVEAPYGFKAAADQAFTVTGTSEKAQTVAVINQRAQYQVKVNSVDAASKAIAGGEVSLFTPDGKVATDVNGKACTATLNDKGNAAFTVEYNEDLVNSKDGGYYAMETAAPKGYALNRNKFAVNVSKDYDFSKAYEITIKHDQSKVNTGVAVGAGSAAALCAAAVVLIITAHKKKSDNSHLLGYK